LLDAVIVGGGPVGACAAALLACGTTLKGSPLKVAVLEPNRPQLPAAEAALDPRVVAVSRASERILTSAGAWERIQGPRIAAYERMRVWYEGISPQSSDALLFDAAEVGEPNLGYVLENRLLQGALLDALIEAGGQVVHARFQGLEVAAEHINVRTSSGTLSARLLIGADGALSAVRQSIGLTAEIGHYGQTAIVATVATERPHQSTAWQRFMRHGTLALLPLADGNSSIVWSADDDIAGELTSAAPSEFESKLAEASDHALGATRLVSERIAFPLRKLSATRYVAQRCALIGDAAHVVHPLAGQGVNLGLLDAATLAQVVLDARQQGEDPGAMRVLRAYERWRKSETVLMSAAIDAFDKFLAHGAGPLSRLARRGLRWVNRSQEIKSLFIRRALGLTGELPRAARAATALKRWESDRSSRPR
jgi:2-octaprenylphenol hydroxylase